MIFKRRDKRGTGRVIRDAVYPPGGWARAVNYVFHRLRRLPDPPHRIARGVAIGMFITFSPLFGAHIPLAGLLAWAIRGNVLAAILGTLVGNPLTFPFIAAMSLTTGHFLTGEEEKFGLSEIPGAFRRATGELWDNLLAVFGPETAHWDYLEEFWEHLFLPYAVGGLFWGSVVGLSVYAVAHRLVDVYQRRRARQMQAKLAARLKATGHIVAE